VGEFNVLFSVSISPLAKPGESTVGPEQDSESVHVFGSVSSPVRGKPGEFTVSVGEAWETLWDWGDSNPFGVEKSSSW
jgi:hypothetical protein